MKSISPAVIAAALALGLSARASAGEHPEHPTATHEKEHPKEEKHEHPKKTKKPDLKKDYSRAVESFVMEETKKDGGLKVPDAVLNKTWNLKLLRIHKNRIADLGNGRYFACADLKENGSKTKVDVDFYATKTDMGWKVDEVVLHKVKGKPRFTYNDKNERVPLGTN
jgi:hypothetical protein